MPVCKYYLQGTCKFGNRCNFDHPRDQRNLQPQAQQQYRVDNSRGGGYVDNRYSTGGSGSGGGSLNRFADLVSRNASPPHHGSSPPHHRAPAGQDAAGGPVSDQDFLELTLWLNSPSSWKLSCFTYSQQAANLPLLEDISPEEVRFGFYDARKRNTLNEFIAQFNQKYKHSVEIISQLANPNHETRQFLLQYFHESQHKPPASIQSNPFMKIVQQKQQQQQQQQSQSTNPFSQQPSQTFNAFTQQQPQLGAFQQTAVAPLTFGTQQHQQQQQPLMTFQSGFENKSNANFNQFNNLSNLKPGGFNWSQQQQQFQQKSIVQPDMNNMSFQSAAVNQPNPLLQPTLPSQSIGFNSGSNNKPNLFSALISSSTAHPSSTYSASTYKLDSNVPLCCYSRLDELTPDELNEYKRASFTLGRLPYNPPAKELC